MTEITVLTCTYNRAHTLHRVFTSLVAQSFKSFEWLVVDDGSSDDTPKKIERWIKEATFPIRYFKKENGGKHTAWNFGLQVVESPFVVILDSDDRCTPDALQVFYNSWADLKAKGNFNSFCAVASLCSDEEGVLVGTSFPMEIYDSDHLRMTFVEQMSGDKWECYRTDVLKEFPFPTGDRVRVIPESLILSRMARKYRTRYLRKVLRIYYDDGIDSSLVRVSDPAKNAGGSFLVQCEVLNCYLDFFQVNPIYFFVTALKLGRSALYLKKTLREQRNLLKPALAVVLWRLALFFAISVVALEKVFLFNGAGKAAWART